MRIVARLFNKESGKELGTNYNYAKSQRRNITRANVIATIFVPVWLHSKSSNCRSQVSRVRDSDYDHPSHNSHLQSQKRHQVSEPTDLELETWEKVLAPKPRTPTRLASSVHRQRALSCCLDGSNEGNPEALGTIYQAPRFAAADLHEIRYIGR